MNISGITTVKRRRGVETTVSAPPAWVPTSISGCVLWLPPAISSMYTDHLGASEVTLDGQVVGLWSDSSGVNNNATQSTAANKPLFKASIQNSLPMVLFDGSNDYLIDDAVSSYFSGDDKATTVAIVFKAVSTAAVQRLFTCGNSGSVSIYQLISISNTPRYNIRKYDATTFEESNPATPAPNTSAAHVYLVRFNGTTVDVWVDTTQAVSGGSMNTGSLVLDVATVGASRGMGVGANFNGYIGEVVVWNAALSNADCTTVRTELISKWGL